MAKKPFMADFFNSNFIDKYKHIIYNKFTANMGRN